MKPIVTGSLAAVAVLSLTANALMYLRYSTSRPLVMVGSQVITKKDYQDALDYQTQGVVLRKMVLADLINQAAAKVGLTPTAADVDARIADVRRRDPQALTAADQDPARMAQVRQELQTQLALENLRIQNVHVTDAEVAAYYAQHKAAFTLPAQVQTTMVVAQNPVDAAQAAALLREGIALDVIERQPRLHVVGMNGFNLNTGSISAADNARLTAAVFRMKPNAVSMVVLGQADVVLHATGRSQGGVPPLSQIRAQVTRSAELDKAVPDATEVARLYRQDAPQFSVAHDADYFADLNVAPSAASPASQKTADAQ